MKKKKVIWNRSDYPYHDFGHDESVYVNGLSDITTAIDTMNENIILIGKLLERSVEEVED